MDLRNFLKPATSGRSDERGKPSGTTQQSASITSNAESGPDTEPQASTSDADLTLHSHVLPDKPYQPPPHLIAAQVLGKKTLSLQATWFKKFAWLHYFN